MSNVKAQSSNQCQTSKRKTQKPITKAPPPLFFCVFVIRGCLNPFRFRIPKNKFKTIHHESTKPGKREKGPVVLYKPLFFRVFVPSCFRDKGLPKAFSLQNTKEPNQNHSTRKHPHPFFFRAFVPRQNNGGQASCFREKGLSCSLSFSWSLMALRSCRRV